MAATEPASPRAGAERRRIEPIGLLGRQDWLDAPETRALLDALAAGGAELRFVGGCVRDAVLKRPVHDIDLATPEPPEQVMARLAASGLRALPTGLAHGTVTAMVGRMRFEITTLRVDAESFGRRARVEFTDDWLADAARRDFTINAMSADASGRIYDPFDGLADLGAGRVRFVGDANTRIEEDALRILRFFRFHAYYGRRGTVDAAALFACRRHAARLTTLSGERVAAEMMRLLAALDPATVLITMHANAILGSILPEAIDFARLRQVSWLENRGLARPEVTPDPLRRLAALLPPSKGDAQAVAERLRLSTRDGNRLRAMVVPALRIRPDFDRLATQRALHHLGAERMRDLILLAWAERRTEMGHPAPAETAAWTALLDAARDWTPVVLPIHGRDLLALGLSPGPKIGEILTDLAEWWEENGFRPDQAECLREARRRIDARAADLSATDR
jgi:poly(A) polymerase